MELPYFKSLKLIAEDVDGNVHEIKLFTPDGCAPSIRVARDIRLRAENYGKIETLPMTADLHVLTYGPSVFTFVAEGNFSYWEEKNVSQDASKEGA